MIACPKNTLARGDMIAVSEKDDHLSQRLWRRKDFFLLRRKEVE
jgi:hypothetical protein